MNNKFFAVSVDALLKTFSVVDAGEAVSFHIEPDDGPSISANDYIIGFVGQGIDQFRMAFVVTNVEGDSLSLSKIIEREDGVSVGDFADAINGQLGSLSAPGCIIELPDLVGKEILNKLQGKVSSQEKKTFVMSSILQLITYGAPGTGKSYKIKGETAGKKVFRTTFHPDSDYATFVGAYKPIMEDVERTALIGDKLKMADVTAVGEEFKKEKVIAYSFVEQVFTKAYIEAWANQKKTAAGGEPEKVYLVIEEINRGNCAQIFGDLFQLLDRNDSGFSDYPIKPDSDFGKFIGEKLSKVGGIFDATRKEEINALYPEIEDGVNVIDAVMTGDLLLLPDNLYIRATMNTSDQSLFPMDSAFKRRWDWEYVPIKNMNLGWKIKFGDCEKEWWKFLVAINKIVKGVTNSADKQLGYFFVKAKDSVIDEKMFVNKVAFYLWNDVFKDCELDYDAFKIPREGGEVDVLAFQDFFKDDGTIDEEVLKSFLTKLVPQSEPEKDAASQADVGA